MNLRVSFQNWRAAILLFIAVNFVLCAKGETVSTAFNDANRLYEQGKFSEAATQYEKIIESGSASPPVYFNLGNALLKSGQMGRAIVAYRAAEKLSPRDPDVRANLQFARNQAGGGTSAPSSRWENWVGRLSLNEWSVLTSLAVAVFFLLLAFRQWRAGLRNSFRGILLALGIFCGCLLICLSAAIRQKFFIHSAVVIVPEAVVRPGPFDESPSAFTLRDGSEVTVIDQKDNWLEIGDATQRTGWLPGKNVVVIGNIKR